MVFTIPLPKVSIQKGSSKKHSFPFYVKTSEDGILIFKLIYKLTKYCSGSTK